ncbi:MAG TPA: glutathione S-transferase [Steroidobacteraceae bacterium]|jgi:glutathione S-transferase|nr:glutathione S-transferase [Steroidobacteraceae bacterium]
MRLIGMLDSPYVRRVAISLQLLGLRFEHRPVSVFREFDEFRAINPVVKAPTLVCDDGTVLMDSSVILEYAQARAGRSLMPRELPDLQADLRIIALGLAACDKSVQMIYERALRPPEKQHEPWLARVTGQLQAALTGLESAIDRRPRPGRAVDMAQAGVTAAITWHFIQQMLPQIVPAAQCPALSAFSCAAEALAPFKAAAHGAGVCVPAIDAA